MNAHSTITTLHRPFNPLAAYEAERQHSRDLERNLSRALQLLSMECTRREHRGEDVSHLRKFIGEASQ